MALTKKSRKIYGHIWIDDNDVAHFSGENYRGGDQGRWYFDEWMKKYKDEYVWVQMGTMNDDFSMVWLRYWWGVVVKTFADAFAGGDVEYTDEVLRVFFPQFGDVEQIRNCGKTLGMIATKEYIHGALKIFFEDQFEPETGVPLRKSFSRDGNIGENAIKNRLPFIQRWAEEHLDLYIPEKGEYIDYRTGEVVEYDLSKAPYNYTNKFKKREAELWLREPKQNETG